MAHILVAEDNEMISLVIAEMLKSMDHTVMALADGQMALRAFNNEKFDCLITDIDMPIMNGLELIRQIRVLNKALPILVITGMMDVDYADFTDALSKQAIDHVLHKPIGYGALKNELRLLGI